MIKLECPHCAAPLPRVRINPGEIINCEFCGGAFEPGDVAMPLGQSIAVESAPCAEQAEPLAPRPTTKAEVFGEALAGVLAIGAGVWRSKSPVTAGLLSFVWSGLGQIHNGWVAIGLALAIVQLIAVFWLGPVVGWPLVTLTWSYSLCNAYACAFAARAGNAPTWDRGLTPALIGGGFVAAMLYLVADVKRAGQLEQADLSRIIKNHPVDQHRAAVSKELNP